VIPIRAIPAHTACLLPPCLSFDIEIRITELALF
jgi:hypothetical protein